MDHVWRISDHLQVLLLNVTVVALAASLTLLLEVMRLLGQSGSVLVVVLLHVLALILVHQTERDMLFVDAAVLLKSFIGQ